MARRFVAGRGFTSGDLRADARGVVVNEYFVKEILAGRNAVGRRVRYTTRNAERSATGQPRGPRAYMREPGEWFEIVGVVKNIGMDTTRDAFTRGKGAVRMAFHVQGDAAAFSPQLREIAHAVHPGLRLYDVLRMDGPLDRGSRNERRMGRAASSITALVALIAILISVAGTSSVMSFTVSRQTREIGIRIALGADRRRIVAGVFSRAMMRAMIQIVIVVGAIAWFYVIVYQLGGGRRPGLLALSAVVLMLVGLAACGLPVKRALRIEPTEALRTVG